MYTPKRKREDAEEGQKKVCNGGHGDKQLYTTLEEWPVYSHPEGGIVKITPWGSLRQFVDQNGNQATRFEDKGFQDYAFAPQYSAGDAYELPSTPQSMHQSSPDPVLVLGQHHRMGLSPLDEAETYVREGYGADEWQSYGQEQENYFGMQNDHEGMV